MIDSYDRLPISKFREIRRIIAEGSDEVDTQAAVIGVLADMDPEDVLDLTLEEYGAMAGKTAFLTAAPKVPKRVPDTVMIDGTRYRVIKDIRTITAGQYIDFQTYISRKDGDSALPEILSCFLIPEGKEYGTGYRIQDAIKAIDENLPITMAKCMADFFYRGSLRLMSSMLCFSERRLRRTESGAAPEMRKRIREARKAVTSLRNSLRDGDGFPASTRWPRG